MNFKDYYDKKEGAVELTRKLYKNGMPISDLLKKIDGERYFTPNKNRRFKTVREDLLTMDDWRKDKLWRPECLAFFLMECFFVSGNIQKLTIGLWENINKNDYQNAEYFIIQINKLIEKKRGKWDK